MQPVIIEFSASSKQEGTSGSSQPAFLIQI